jgi:hypothetical protein
MRASRLVSILLMLQTRGRVTAQELADAFEISVRTIALLNLGTYWAQPPAATW